MANEIVLGVQATIKINRKGEVKRRIDFTETGQKMSLEEATKLAKSLLQDLETEYPNHNPRHSWCSPEYTYDFTRRSKLND